MKKKASRRKIEDRPSSRHVFVSHATYDKFLAKTICEKIEALGIATFRDDRDICGGDVISEEIKEAIRTSKEVTIILTPESVKRQWVLIEIGMAVMAERRIVPILYHLDPSDIPDIIRDKRGYLLDHFDDYLKDLESRIRETMQ